jgi:glucosamine-6-phosphate deaminase
VTTPVAVFDDAEQLGRTLAERIAYGISTAKQAGRRYVLGCPGGRSARSTYVALRDVVQERALPLDHVVIAMMDDYVVPAGDGGLMRAHQHEHYSCERFAWTEIVEPLNAAASTPIGPDGVLLPDPLAPGDYDQRLAAIGGIDLFLLASGATDGHVAFNPAGSEPDSRTRVVELARETRRDNLATFPDFRSLDDVPRLGVTVGIGTIAELSAELVMILNGSYKQTAFQRISQATSYDHSWPATVVHLGARREILADRQAAGCSAHSDRPARSCR